MISFSFIEMEKHSLISLIELASTLVFLVHKGVLNKASKPSAFYLQSSIKTPLHFCRSFLSVPQERIFIT